MMLEKTNPIGEQIALAGVYQAKLELIDKLIDKELTWEDKPVELTDKYDKK